MKPFQVGVIVPDLEAAMAELSASLGLSFGVVKTRGSEEIPLRVVYAQEGPPYIELIEGPPGSPWDAGAGPELHHLGYWADDFEGERSRALEGGLELEIDGEQLTKGLSKFAYMKGKASGIRVELLDRSLLTPVRESVPGIEA